MALDLVAIPSLELLVGEKGTSSFDSSNGMQEGIGENGKDDLDGSNCIFL